MKLKKLKMMPNLTQGYYWCIIKHAKSNFDFGDGAVVVQCFNYRYK